MSSFEAKSVPANNSVTIEDTCKNNDEIPDTNDELLIPDEKDIDDNDILKKSMQKQHEEVIREKKEKFYEFKNSDNKTSESIATSKHKRNIREISRRHISHYKGLDFKWYHTREIEQQRTCC